MSGKGDARRPSFVPDEVLAERWARTFGRPVTPPHSDTPRPPETGNVPTREPAKGEGA